MNTSTLTAVNKFDPALSHHWDTLTKHLATQPVAQGFMIIARQQYEHNLNQAGPDWCNSGYNWLRYMRVELYELMDHYGTFKHWKAASTDLPQARMELVDVMIFALSHAIENRRVINVCMVMAQSFADLKEFEVKPEDLDVNKLCDDLALTSHRGAVDYDALASLAYALNMTGPQFSSLYELKMALNHVRQANGYADGTYLKTWFGQEDNQVVQANVYGSEVLMKRAYASGPASVQGNLRVMIQEIYDKAVAHHESS